jgi:hypothetical protein
LIDASLSMLATQLAARAIQRSTLPTTRSLRENLFARRQGEDGRPGAGRQFAEPLRSHAPHYVYHGLVHEPGDALKAETMLAKHDENYMAREVIETPKKGRWYECTERNPHQGNRNVNWVSP